MCSQDINWARVLNELSLSEEQLIPLKDRNFTVAFSAGADSVLSLFFVLLLHRNFNTSRKLQVFYLDHYGQGAPGKERRELIEHYHKLADKEPGLETELILYSRDVTAISDRLKRSFENTGSRLRRRFLSRISQRNQAWPVLGHNLSDWYETAIMRLNRGTSIEKLLPHSFIERGYHHSEVRPLHLVTRNRVRQLCQVFNLDFFDDPSNADTSILRNLVRKDFYILNEKGLARSASNLISQKRAVDFDKITCIKPGREYRFTYTETVKTDPAMQWSLLSTMLELVGFYPVSSEYRKQLQRLPFYCGAVAVEIENWYGTLYLVCRRGQMRFSSTEKLLPNQAYASDLAKSDTIQLSFGRKSLSKILSEKKLSLRQRKNLVVELSSKKNIRKIFLSSFGLEDITAVQ